MMTIRQMLPLLAIASLLSCSKKTDSQDDQPVDSASVATPASAGPGCFVYQMQKDSAFLRVQTAGRAVTGELSYNLHEKDSNKGTLAGTIQGDTLIANYTFSSEGRQSVREVAFLRTGSGWIEGFGEVKDSAGTMLFKDRSALNFEKGLYFNRIDCPAAD